MQHFTSNGADQCRNGSSNLLTSITRATSIDSDYCRLTHGQRSQQQSGNPAVSIKKPKLLKATHHTEIRKIEIPRSVAVEALSW